MVSQLRVQHLTSVALLAGMLARPAVAAADAEGGPSGANDNILQEVVVTASKRSESLQEVPAAVTALTGDAIEQQGLTQFSDYMTLVPGLSQNSGGAPGHGLVILRGLSTGLQQTASTVSYLIDDIPFTANDSLAIGSLLTPDPDLTDIDRIEVLKGPQGTLYGASALGGLIKIVSKRPTTDEFSGEVRGDLASVAHGGTGYGIRGSLNIPIVSDIAAVRVSAFHRDDPGFEKNVLQGRSDANSDAVSGGKVILRVQPTSNLDIDLSGLIQNLHSSGFATVTADPLTLAPVYCKYCYADAVGPVLDTQYRIAGLVVNWTLPAGTLTNSLSYGKYTDAESFDYTPQYGVFNTLFGLPVPANTAVIGTLAPSMRKITEELRFATQRLGDFEGLGGVFYTHEHNQYDAVLTNRVPPSLAPVAPPFDNLVTSDITPIYKEYAAFANLTYYFLPSLDLTLGGRYTHNQQEADNFGEGILNGGTVQQHFNSSEHPTTYLVTVRYRPMDQVDTYARLATGYRPGGPQLTVGPNIPTSFKSDSTKNYELGLKSRWLDSRLTANLALYYIDWNDIQVNELIGGLQVNGNGGKARSRGVELEIAYLPVRGLTTQLNLSYNRATTDVAVPAVGAIAGDTLPFSAKITGAEVTDYVFPLPGNFRGNVGFTYAYQGSRPTSWSEDPLNHNVVLPGYGTLDVRAGIAWDQYSLQLRGENVTDRYAYSTSSEGNLFPGQGVPAMPVLITPRTVVLELTAKF
jgi:iron complex outermembrane receptor protein